MGSPDNTPGRPLRVGLNLLFLGERAGGIGRYASRLPGAILAVEPQTELHLFVSREAPEEVLRADWASAVRWHKLPVRPGGSRMHVPAQFLALPPLALTGGLDVLHSPANTGPVITPGLASVITLHDLIWLHRPHEWEASRRAHIEMRIVVGHCVRHATRVLTDSRAAAADIVETLGVEASRLSVTPLGVDVPPAASPAGEQQLRAKLDLGSGRVVLSVAQKRPYKNLRSLIYALPGLDDDVVLVLPGAHTEHETELRELATTLGVLGRVRFPDWLDDAELDALYRLADVFVLPSLIEGFGLPVLEAMARELPVACSDRSALPEVVGDAALLFDPECQEEVTGAIARLLGDHGLSGALRERGRLRAALYSWERTGATTLAGYRGALAAGLRGRGAEAPV